MASNLGPLILGVDLEGVNEDLVNSGLNLDVDRVTEIGAVLWDWKLGQPVKIFSELIDEADRLSINQELYELTGINDEMLTNYAKKGEGIGETLDALMVLIEKADYLMAHNATGYDKPMLNALFRRHGKTLPDRVWIDTYLDIEFPKKMGNKSMMMLEHQHGFINPFPHRAVTDVLSMLKIASQYDVQRMIKLAESPMVKIVAQLDAPNWRNRAEVEEFNKVKNKVSKARFRWNPDKKTWFKEVHKLIIDEDKIDYDFEWYFVD